MALSLPKLRMEYNFHLLDSSDNAHMEDSDPERLRLEGCNNSSSSLSTSAIGVVP